MEQNIQWKSTIWMRQPLNALKSKFSNGLVSAIARRGYSGKQKKYIQSGLKKNAELRSHQLKCRTYCSPCFQFRSNVVCDCHSYI